MGVRAGQRVQRIAAVVAVAAPVASHAALALGAGGRVALGLAGVQAVAVGLVVWTALSRWRWVGPVLTAVLLSGVVAGARVSVDTGLLVSAGLSHAILYGALLAVFAASLRPGRTSLVTMMARRINPTFHAGMVPYTRAVNAAWCLFFAGQLVVSAALLMLDVGRWRLFVTMLHVPLVVAMAVGESLVRRWRWRHEHATGLLATIRGVQRIRAEAAAACTSRPAADCPGRSENGTRRPQPGADSGPGPAG